MSTHRAGAQPNAGLRQLWNAWLNVGEVPPAFDRFFTRYLREHAPDGPTRSQLGASLAPQADALLTWGVLASYERFAGQSGAGAVSRFCDQVRGPADLLRLWRSADDRFFHFCLSAAQRPPALAEALWAQDLPAWCLAVGLPPWHSELLSGRLQRSGADWLRSWLQTQTRRPALWLRPRDPSHIERLTLELRGEGLSVTPEGEALRVSGPTPINHTQAWIRGDIEVQDLASQAVGAALPLRPGEIVWDCCAGNGGKTLQLAARLYGKGAVHASDIDARRLSALKLRARRAGVPNVRTWVWDARVSPTLPPEVKKRGGFDAVLVDAPCSGSGTWRRKPDGRLRGPLSPRWAEQQRALLLSAREQLRPGGALLYATCSVAVEENEAVVEAVCALDPELQLQSQALYGAPGADADSLFGALIRRRG